MTQNIGSLENYGMEFSINAKPIVTKDFTWTSAITLHGTTMKSPS